MSSFFHVYSELKIMLRKSDAFPQLGEDASRRLLGKEIGPNSETLLKIFEFFEQHTIENEQKVDSARCDVKGKGKGVPQQARCGPEGSRKFRLTDFHDSRHMRVVKFSASRTGRLYLQ
jgi:hypothetical protein